MPPTRTRAKSLKEMREEIALETDPEAVWRTTKFLDICEIQFKLEAQYKKTNYNDSEFEALGFKRDTPLNIDDQEDRRVEATFFLPCPVDLATAAIKELVRPKPEVDMYPPWCYNEPMEPRPDKKDFGRILDYHDERMAETDYTGRFIANATKSWNFRHCNWNRHSLHPKKMSYFREVWTDSDGDRVIHEFYSSIPLMFTGGHRKYLPNPDIPHAIGTVYDSLEPDANTIMRSELENIARLLKLQIKHFQAWPQHRIFPVLILSFHSRLTARIIQARFEDGSIILRVSRLLNLHTKEISEDARILVQWLLSDPIGVTKLEPSKQG